MRFLLDNNLSSALATGLREAGHDARLPHHIDASDRALYDLGDEHRRELVYRLVLLEAVTDEDLETWLNRDELIRLWPELYLPRAVRAAWEQRHAVLRERGAGPHVPRP